MATTDVVSPGGAAAGGRVPGGNSPAGRTPAGRAPTAPATGTAPVGPTRVARAVQFYHDVLAEMKRVTWPARLELRNATVQIIIFVLLVGALIALMDIALQFVLVRLPALLLGAR